MAVVDRKKIDNVRYLFGSPSTVKSRYNQMKRTFPEEKEYLIFAEPVYVGDTNSIIWSTEHTGSIINFQKLSPSDQSNAKRLLTKSIQTLLSAANRFETDEFTEFIYNCIEIPSMDNVFLVRGQSSDKVVLSEWGFVSDVPGMEKGLLAKIIDVKRVDMLFDVVYEDGEAATNEKFTFEYEEETAVHISDVNAQIKLLEVKVDEEVNTYQEENGEKLQEQSFICYDNGKYKLTAIRRIDMLFTVQNQNGTTLPGITFTFSYNGATQNLTSDSEGLISLPNIRIKSSIDAYQIENETQINVHNFICEKDKKNILQIDEKEDTPPPLEKPQTHDMRLRVEDNKGNPVENAKVKISYNGKTVEQMTDAEGYTMLQDVTPNTKIKVKAIGKPKKKK